MAFCPDILRSKLQQDVLSNQKKSPLVLYRLSVLERTILKKYIPTTSAHALHTDAISSFIDRNERLGDKFIVLDKRRDLFKDWQNRIYDTMMTEPYQASVLNLNQCFLLGRPGPGATRGTRHTDFYRKMWTSNYTYTNDLLATHYESSLSDRWAQASLLRREGFTDRQVYGSSLTSVPKDSSKNRCICTEPSINMFYQLGAHEIISQVLKRHFKLDISVQPEINKQAARLGSINGSNATIDLSDASDHIHYDLVRQLLPPEVFRVLDVLRSPGFSVDGVDRKFNMISSMGNGFTFALMTYLIVTLLDVFLNTYGSRYTPLRDGVFGDDIILPSYLANEFIEVLSDFGFKVNVDKSFITGPFRESCGGDFYLGHDVRGIYIKGVNNEAETYSAFNRLVVWSIKHGIYLDNVLLYLKGLVDFRPVPLGESDTSGFRVPYWYTTSRKHDNNGAVYYRPLVAVAATYRLGDKSRNPFGAYISALGGYVRGHTVSYRVTGMVQYKVAKRKTPCWDFPNHPELNTQEHDRFWLRVACS